MISIEPTLIGLFCLDLENLDQMSSAILMLIIRYGKEVISTGPQMFSGIGIVQSEAVIQQKLQKL